MASDFNQSYWQAGMGSGILHQPTTYPDEWQARNLSGKSRWWCNLFYRS